MKILLSNNTSINSINDITFGLYSKNSLNETFRRLAILIYGQELYYPRPNQIIAYKNFKKGYLNQIDKILFFKYEKLKENFKNEIKNSSLIFFEEYEKIDKQKIERNYKMGKTILF
ncbi:uncharacterized protein I206_106486 [Kwoniella pini CBS 10737]|uniref:Uncharacterized protein n=1 Tax=Kwoniella pini CBS 10737 TaxID=1296096 RepID=A0A1B9HUG0_9TREE|nr:uncharacterized protein I206_07291 [Kwoniella pini CBS 10737]OCF46904.1 hypothetical protein I206_07291 [Kwoniella pini CBS 10737]